jgi:peptidoglycan/xylan/chitin deacetylase (PgdA/CDA1 family)
MSKPASSRTSVSPDAPSALGEAFPADIVLAYHSILPAGSPPNPDQHCIPLDRLLEHLDALQGNGFQNVSLADAYQRLVGGGAESGAKRFAVTFDDGYVSLARFLPPLCDRLQPTLFLLTQYTGLSNLTWNTRTPYVQQHLTLQQIFALAECGVDMQFHGTDHHNLLKFDAEQLHQRFAEGQAWFEGTLGKKADFIAYPYGYCNIEVQQVAAQHFRGGLTVNHGAWCGPSARYALNRLSVPAYLSGKDLVDIIHSPPSTRWLETERRAPWRGKSSRP